MDEIDCKMQPQEVGEADRLWSSGHGDDSESSSCSFTSSVRDAACGGFLLSLREHMLMILMRIVKGNSLFHNDDTTPQY